MNGQPGLTCPQCSAARDIYRYCMNCGFDYATLADQGAPAESETGTEADTEAGTEADTAERPVATLQPVLPPPSGDAPTPIIGGRSAPIIIGLIVAAVFVLVLIVAAIVSLFGTDEDPTDTTASDTATSDGSADDPSSTDTTQASCWDGTEAATLGECSEPTGAEGLAWVFPSFDQQDCREQRAEPAKWNCTVTTSEGGEVQIRYREHKGVKRPLAVYTAKYGTDNRTEVLSGRDDVERYVWRAPDPNDNGVWTASSMYADHPWSVTIKGLTSDEVEAAINNDVEFRNPRRLSGTPAEG